jgi:hypothetical protein
MRLPPTTAAAAAAAIVAAGAVLGFSRAPNLLVWAAFIGWASYDHSGANPQALLRSSAGLLFGVIMACAVALFVALDALPLSVMPTTAVSAGIASFAIVMASRLPLLSVVPAAFYGFASTFAYASLAPGAFAISAVTGLDGHNPLLVLPVSLLAGTGLGVVHGWLAKTLAPNGTEATPEATPARALRLDGSVPVYGDGRKHPTSAAAGDKEEEAA